MRGRFRGVVPPGGSTAAREAIAASATRVESGRVWPPSMTAVTFRYRSPSSASTCPVYPRAITTRISSIPGAAWKAATHRSISVLPPRVSNCFGMPAPSRWPTPPPSTTATIRMSRTLPARFAAALAGKNSLPGSGA